MDLLLLFFFLSVAFSFLCSTLESALMSTTHSYIQLLEEEGNKYAARMKAYKNDPERPLAAILSLNTIANTVGAAGVGQQATLVFGSQWFGLVSALVTICILFFGEIIPKTIGSTYWRSLTGFVATTVHVLIIVLFPVVWIVEKFGRLVDRTDDDDPTVSREEVIALASVGEEEGVIEEDENKIIRNLMRLEQVKAGEVMTPSVVANIAPETMTLREYYDSDDYDHHSRIPVYADDNPDYITGYILRDDALEDLAEDHFKIKLRDIRRPLPAFSEDDNLSDIFDQMLRQKSQIAQIIDEYGCFRGILTLEDIVETIFGLEIVDESDVITDMQQYARERWQKRQARKNGTRSKAAAKAEGGD